jgi:hypothetical protein
LLRNHLVGTPRSRLKQFETELLKEDWTRVRPDVEVKQAPIPQGEETYILCRTAGRKEKERAIRKRFSTSMASALQRLQKTIATGRLKDRNKMERRLGKIQARHPQVNDLYAVALRDTAEGVRLLWQMKEDRKTWARCARRRLPAAHQSSGGNCRTAVVEIQAVDRSRSLLPSPEE